VLEVGVESEEPLVKVINVRMDEDVAIGCAIDVSIPEDSVHSSSGRIGDDVGAVGDSATDEVMVDISNDVGALVKNSRIAEIGTA
jgi:hypothetical protein